MTSRVTKKRVVALGEVMLRLAAPKYERIGSATSFDATYAGAEANVLASLANFEVPSSFVSKVPNNDLGSAVLRSLRAVGIDTEYVLRGGSRLGVYFLEHGASVRGSKVVYDRSHSSMTEATANDFDFEKIFENADWFHVSGITAGVSAMAPELVERALKTAKSMGLTTSFDFNHRAKMWSLEEAQKVCNSFMQYVDVCLDASLNKTLESEGQIKELEDFEKVFIDLYKKYGFKYIASTLRKHHSSSDNDLSGLLFDGKKFYQSVKHNLHIVDRVGGGDAFSGGVIYSLLDEKSMQESIDFAVAASALKHTIEGDFNQMSVKEVENLADNKSDGKVAR